MKTVAGLVADLTNGPSAESALLSEASVHLSTIHRAWRRLFTVLAKRNDIIAAKLSTSLAHVARLTDANVYIHIRDMDGFRAQIEELPEAPDFLCYEDESIMTRDMLTQTDALRSLITDFSADILDRVEHHNTLEAKGCSCFPPSNKVGERWTSDMLTFICDSCCWQLTHVNIVYKRLSKLARRLEVISATYKELDSIDLSGLVALAQHVHSTEADRMFFETLQLIDLVAADMEACKLNVAGEKSW